MPFSVRIRGSRLLLSNFLALTAGILLGDLVADSLPFWIPGVLLLGAWAAWFGKKETLALGGVFLFFFFLGFWRVQSVKETGFSPGSRLSSEKVWFEGVVQTYPKKLSPRGIAFDVSLEGSGHFERVRLFSLSDSVPRKGERVFFRTKLKTARNYGNEWEFDRETYAKTRGISFQGVISGSHDLICKRGSVGFLQDFFNGIRESAQILGRANMTENGFGIFQAMLFGNRSEVSEEIVHAFRRAGIIHLLVVSGFHVGVVALFFGWLFGMGWRCSHRLIEFFPLRKVQGVAAFLGAFFYASLTDLPISTVRALIFFGLGLLALFFARTRKVLNVCLVAAFFCLLFQPLFLFDVSAQLSFSAVLGIALVMQSCWFPQKGKLRQLFWVSLGAWLATFPILVWHFGQVTLWSPLANMIFVPLLGGVGIPLGLLAILISPLWMFIASWLFRILDLWLSAFLFLAESSIHLPGSDVWISRIQFGFVLLAVVLVFYAFYKKMKTSLLLIAGALAIGFFSFLIESVFQNPGIHFLHVGQGDAALMITNDRKVALVDAGRGGLYSEDAGEKILLPWLRKHGYRELELMILTHEDMDHIGGAKTVLKGMTVHDVWIPVQKAVGPAMEEIISLSKDLGVGVRRVRDGWHEEIGNLSLRVFHPPSDQWEGSSSDNESSIVLQATMNGTRVLFTGDIEHLGEDRLMKKKRALLKSEVLKVAHHGSRRSTSRPFLEFIAAKEAVIPAGWKNSYGHPAKEVLNRLRNSGLTIWRGDLCGQVSLFPIKKARYDLVSVRDCKNHL